MKIRDFFEKNKNVVVALSGGVDSAVLLYLARAYAENAYAVFVKTEFQPEFEQTDAEKICKCMGTRLYIINASVLDNESIAANPKNRCYYCKQSIFRLICEFAESKNAIVIEGTNADDEISDRPGYKAITEFNVSSPLREYGYTKSDIRRLAKEHNIPVHDKPSYACLATRIPVGERITKDILHKTEKAENELFKLGFNDFRIRYTAENALLELTDIDRKRYLDNKEKIDNMLLKHYKKIILSTEIRNGTG